VDHGQFDHRAEGLIVVNAGSLGEAMKNPASLVTFQGAIEIKLVLENPLASDDVGANGVRNKIPAVVNDQGNKFFFHGAAPIQIDEGGADEGVHQQQDRRRSGRQGESVSWKPEAPLHPRDHRMMVDRKIHGYGLCQRRLLMYRR
jgi:hypothetical protein